MKADDLGAFERLAEEVGVVLPALLRALIASGRTHYGSEWPAHWRERLLQAPPALASCFDFEWIDIEAAQREVDDWLNPQLQSGRRFLPFAQTGAGDCYCLMPLESGGCGVALVWHDRDEAVIGYRSFSGFVCVQYLSAFADLGHLLEDGCSETEALQVLRLDVGLTASMLSVEEQEHLQGFLERPPAQRWVSDGRCTPPRQVLSLISESESADEAARYTLPSAPRFKVVPSWERPSIVAAHVAARVPEPLDWRAIASDPARKMQAIRAYQAQTSADLAEAKRVVDAYLASLS